MLQFCNYLSYKLSNVHGLLIIVYQYISVFVISALSSTYFIEYGKIILFLGILFSIIMVFVFAPTESENKPLSKKKHKKNKTLSRIIVTVLSLTAICLYFTKETTGHIYITAAVAMSFESLSLLKH